ncbi:glycosyltransferase family 4 protein [Thaumasiovibrio sp. DFM-14]|uniref:glycosyltransferase family 4 protein n=1 Tax=Thaumasiovibrio sp. DFM-14 TaxID=3384792 RepID=UPI0039A2E525
MQVTVFLDSSGFGGIESHVLQLAKMLHQYGKLKQVLFWRYYPNHPLYEALKEHQLPYGFCDSSIRRLYQITRTLGKGDCVHAHGYKASLLVRSLVVNSVFKCITTYHAGDRGRGKVWLYEALNRLSGPLSLNLGVSQPICDAVLGPCQRINNFVDMAPYRGIEPVQKTDKRLRFAFVGRLSHEKGLDRFVHLSTQFQQHEWHVYGDGPQRHALHDAPHIHNHGQVSSMLAHWQHIDVLILPSRQEGLPMVALEAMAARVVVLATNVGQLPQLLPAFSVVSEQQWQEMSQRISDMSGWSQRQWHEVQVENRQRIFSSYSTEALWPCYRQIYLQN